jgi:hypothetical protein
MSTVRWTGFITAYERSSPVLWRPGRRTRFDRGRFSINSHRALLWILLPFARWPTNGPNHQRRGERSILAEGEMLTTFLISRVYSRWAAHRQLLLPAVKSKNTGGRQ